MKFSISRQCEHPGCTARLELVLEIPDRAPASMPTAAADAAALAAGWRRLRMIPPGLADASKREELVAQSGEVVAVVCDQHVPRARALRCAWLHVQPLVRRVGGAVAARVILSSKVVCELEHGADCELGCGPIAGVEGEHVHLRSCTVDHPLLKRTDNPDEVTCPTCKRATP